nr:unnamed protein product [Digitaria exilis]
MRPRCASRPPPQLREGLRRFRGGLARSSSEPTAASEAKDCDLPSKNLDRPLLKGSCAMSPDISKPRELASSSSSDDDESSSPDVDDDDGSESDGEPMSSSCSSHTMAAAASRPLRNKKRAPDENASNETTKLREREIARATQCHGEAGKGVGRYKWGTGG